MPDKAPTPAQQLITAVGELTVYLTTAAQAKLKEKTPKAHWHKVNELEADVEAAVERFGTENLGMLTREQATQALLRQSPPPIVHVAPVGTPPPIGHPDHPWTPVGTVSKEEAQRLFNPSIKSEWQAPDCQDDD